MIGVEPFGAFEKFRREQFDMLFFGAVTTNSENVRQLRHDEDSHQIRTPAWFVFSSSQFYRGNPTFQGIKTPVRGGSTLLRFS